MEKFLDEGLTHLKTSKYSGLGFLVSTLDGIPLVHNLGAEENTNDLAAVSSAMWAFGQKINHQKEITHQSVEINTKDFIFIIIRHIEDTFCLFKIPHSKNIDKEALINESRIAFDKATSIQFIR